MNHPRHNPCAQRRRGMLLISVLICLAVVMTLFAVWLRIVALERRQLVAQRDRMQAEYLARSGVERARAQLAHEPSYLGETWRVDKDSLAARAGATVVIRVTAVPDQAQARRVSIETDFPDQGPARVRRSREVTMILPMPTAPPPAGAGPTSGEAS